MTRHTVAKMAIMSLVAGLLLTGCAPPRPNEVTLPRVFWDDDIEPTSPLENDPLVTFARTATAAEAYAMNTGNFAFPQLIDSYGEDWVNSLYEQYLDQRTEDATWVYPGPSPWQPLRIERDPTPENVNARILVVCGNVLNWLINAEDPTNTGTFDRTKTTTGYIHINHYPEEGPDSYAVVDRNYGGSGFGNFGTGEPCDGSQVPVGRYQTTPPFPRVPVTEAPYPPLPTSDDQ
ncbi:hypothetical protein ACL9RL_16765 [Plantibacter sp. Mn2098]|uniref:hypothetical protein n=1 Tax=Plantibacter sp. Mn2098 TaxID=3395266 RepID=UPI003BD42CEC